MLSLDNGSNKDIDSKEGPRSAMLELPAINLTTRVQVLNEDFYNSPSAKTLWKCNPTILPQAMGETVRQTRLFSLSIAIGFRGRKTLTTRLLNSA